MTDRDPFSEIDELFERLNRELDQFGGQFDPSLPGRGVKVDIAEHDDELVVTADLPGFEKDDIEVTIQEGTLTIEADREVESTQEAEADDGPRFHRRERSRTAVSRRIRLPVEVDKADARATYANGVLTITLPKLKSDDGGHTIDVS
ncbi:Molecular chaperone (HSP20 family) [Halalkaliarchaeum sp. AArc-CO]|uniref:archaeal heat shock protein Hsp14 n=1 Tax=unclassified Halalkaliarchaeum TaxID=2678344 RepID=UPI00217D08B2|nr:MULTISPECIES: archaeal heat shock protein Hsp14 [unclassified Halalkaliarchaeum]MDR5673711.1 archaeal heat shock protein Hsp14 [Halalkaliarchaeum sp. AArc-GB]UWG52092.1 Molecular chaperone (HSP20 family) [Halalkaliarchaeum sp. AArc-CO]